MLTAPGGPVYTAARDLPVFVRRPRRRRRGRILAGGGGAARLRAGPHLTARPWLACDLRRARRARPWPRPSTPRPSASACARRPMGRRGRRGRGHGATGHGRAGLRDPGRPPRGPGMRTHANRWPAQRRRPRGGRGVRSPTALAPPASGLISRHRSAAHLRLAVLASMRVPGGPARPRVAAGGRLPSPAGDRADASFATGDQHP